MWSFHHLFTIAPDKHYVADVQNFDNFGIFCKWVQTRTRNKFQVLISTSPVKYTSWIDKQVLITFYLKS